MKKTHLIILASLCAAPLMSASQGLCAFVYRYEPGVPAVTTHMSVLKEAEEAQQPVKLIPPADVAPQELSHPFFTNTMLAPLSAHPVARHEARRHVSRPVRHVARTPEQPVPQNNVAETAQPAQPAPVKLIPPPPEPAPVIPPPETAAPAQPAVPSLADLTLDFDTASSLLTHQAKTKLDDIAQQMKDINSLRLQIRGFAKGNGGADSARRMSLSRVLEVRSYLMDKGVKPVRLDVQALGSGTSRQPIDRVDLVFVR